MTRLVLRWVIIAIAVWVAVLVVPGIQADPSDYVTIAVIAIILGLVNALVRPILTLLSCPLIALTLGLFILVLNAVTFWLAAWVGQQFGLGFSVTGFVPAFLGALVVSVVSALLNLFVRDDHESKR
jgi:putative membrane protein